MANYEEESGEKKEVNKAAYWCQEIADAKKREKTYRKFARGVVSIYETDKSETMPFNILYSNTETLQASLYNSTPRPAVGRRFKDEDPLGKLASEVVSRYLEFFIDSNDRDYSNFDEMMRSAVLEGLVPGRGVTRFKYDAEMEKTEAVEAVEGVSEAIPASERVVYETVCGEEVPWDRIMFGYAKRWSETPWIAFEHFMSREDLEKNFGAEAAKDIKLTVTEKTDSDNDSEDGERTIAPKDLGEATLAQIFEVWDKIEKQVIFICPEHKDKELKRVDDPLQLSGFFPIPRPLIFGQKLSSLIPVPLYAYYEEQDKELNRITVRINKIVKALKVRGFYDSSLQGIEKVLTANDNELVPVENAAAMQQGQTLEKSIWLMPIEKLINVLQQLYLQRTQVKAIIYEITAIADIMRGASAASETLGAQEIKTQWGSLRLRKLQVESQRYVRDCLRIAAEIAFKHLSQETLTATVNLQLPTREQQAQAKAALQQMQQQQQQQATQAQMMGQPPPPASPPPAQLTQVLSIPAVEDVLELLKDDLHRNYKVDIETNSTIEADSREEKKDVGEFLNALAQFLNGALPMVQSGMMPFDVVKEILGAVTRRFKFGVDIEDALKKMQAPKPPPDKEGAKGPDPQVEAQKGQIELKLKEQEAQAKVSALTRAEELGKVEAGAKMAALQRAEELAMAKHVSQLKQLALKNQAAAAKEASDASV